MHVKAPLITTNLLYKNTSRSSGAHRNDAARGVEPDMTVIGPHVKR